jgi:uncharacterized protein (DUF427 family)
VSTLPWQRELVPWPRRLRARLGGETIVDTRAAVLLRQHGFLPVFWLPVADVAADLLVPSTWTTASPYRGTATYWHVRCGDRVAESAAWTYADPLPGSPDLRGYVSLDFHSMDAWYEEEERIYVHARDPYLRADARRSSRHVVVEVGGTVVAETRRPVRLDETGLITRWYVPLADVERDLLEPSSTFTECPYKGRAEYWSVRSGDGALSVDAAWGYAQPLPDVGAVAGHLCFWQEREDTVIRIDGDVLPRPTGAPGGDGHEAIPAWRARYVQPPPESMRGVAAGALARDVARPNNRAEGPPGDVMDMAVERAGGTRLWRH